MTIRAIAVAEPVPHDRGSTSQTFLAMTAPALEPCVPALERVRGQLCVVESLDFEGISGVTHVTLSLWRGETELPCMNVEVAACTLAWSAPIRRTAGMHPVARRRLVAAITRGLGVRARQRP